MNICFLTSATMRWYSAPILLAAVGAPVLVIVSVTFIILKPRCCWPVFAVIAGYYFHSW